MTEAFVPTDQQRTIIDHDGTAFVSACPGAGKTRVLVERARKLLARPLDGRGIAFLSFTNAAVSELAGRLRREGLLATRTFPHFIATFDGFLWQFLLAPLGIPGCLAAPRLIPDLDERTITPFNNAQPLPLFCFDRRNGEIIPGKARECGFDIARNQRTVAAYKTAAANTRARFRASGEIDFEDMREIVHARLSDGALSARLGAALAARFVEVVVDEAQDCNPADLEIVRWLRDVGIATKVICDPHQSIYGFRGGVTEHLYDFRATFRPEEILTMTGNFRSTPAICKAVVVLRPPNARAVADEALGPHKDLATPVHVLAYPAGGVPATIGPAYGALLASHGLDIAECPLLAKTHNSGANAIGQPTGGRVENLTMRLAMAVAQFHFSLEIGSRVAAMVEMHRVVLGIEGAIEGGRTYGQHLASAGVTADMWRPRILELLQALRYEPAVYPTPNAWHTRAKAVLSRLCPAGGRTIAQRLPWNDDLNGVLAVPPPCCPSVKTIHAAKGMEFPAVCVVMTTATAKGILDYLETGVPLDKAEAAREIYVAASRAERLLVIAIPTSQARRLAARLRIPETSVTLTELDGE